MSNEEINIFFFVRKIDNYYHLLIQSSFNSKSFVYRVILT